MSVTYKDILAQTVVPPGRVPIKVSELPAATQLTGDEIFPFLQEGTLKQGTLAMLNQIPAAPSDVAIEAAVAVGRGMVIATNLTGKGVLAIANSIAGVRIVGLSEVTAPANVGITLTNSYLRLNDWSAAIGSVQLTPNTEYFLSALTAGQLVATPPTAPGSYVMSIGVAVNQETLAIKIGHPILN